jgi:16S rRNA G966 N2-methylase RsmD
VNRTIDALDRAEIVKSDGIVIAEHHKKEGVADKIGSLKKRREKRYGETVLSYFGFDEDSNCR